MPELATPVGRHEVPELQLVAARHELLRNLPYEVQLVAVRHELRR